MYFGWDAEEVIPPPNYTKRGRDLRLRSPDHLRFVRKRLCCIYDKHVCSGRVEACHLRNLSPEKGMGTKPSDLYVVGGCRDAHRQMEGQERQFEARYGVDLMTLAFEYAEKSPDKRVKACARALREVMKPDKFSADEIAEMVEQVMRKIREQER